MGVLDFFKIRVVLNSGRIVAMEELGREVKLKDLAGSSLCIDASLMIYNAILAMEHVTALTDSAGRTTSHINTIFNKVIQLAEAGISQLWIFDSPEANPLKKKTLELRAERRRVALERGYKNSHKVEYRLTSEHVKDIQNLLEALGIMYVVAPPGVEAEQYGAYLTRGPESQRFCKYMISSDSDVLCFGGNLLRVTSQKLPSGSRKTVYEVFELQEILELAGLTQEEFLKMCVLLGTDFNERNEEKIGPGRVIEAVKKNTAFINFSMERAMNYFRSDISEQVGEAEIVKKNYSPEEALQLLLERNFNEERIKKRLKAFEATLSS